MLSLRYHPSHKHRTARGLGIVRRRVVRLFRSGGYKGAYSAGAYTLPFVLEWLIDGKIPFTLQTNGEGYYLTVQPICHSMADRLFIL